MSVGELNQLMTYVIDGWMLLSAGFISIGFVSFVSRRIQEDIEADAVALANQQSAAVGSAETTKVSVTEAVKAVSVAEDAEAIEAVSVAEDAEDAEAVEDAARLEEVAAVSEQLAKTRSKQSDSSSVSVST